MGFFLEIKEKGFVSPSQQPFLPFQPPPPPSISVHTGGFNLNNKVSPSVLLIIIILAIIFFISGLLHLLVRFLLRPPNRDPDELENVTALQGQLQQLFHLHDSGVDQSFIDTLPVFNYKAIIGVKDPFDCAVCLCEFEAEDKLRLLPKCSHAFHMGCIDTWLLSHSTCPLCRASLIPDFSRKSNCSPIVLVLESGSESSREIGLDRDGGIGLDTTSSFGRVNSHLSLRCDDEFRQPQDDPVLSSCEIQSKDEGNQQVVLSSGEKVVPVKLGKFQNVEGRGEGSSDDDGADARRCFSMGSFAYVMDENLTLQVPIRTPMKKQSIKKPSLPLTPGHRQALSECGGCDSRRELVGFDAFRIGEIQEGGNDTSVISGNDRKAIGKDKKESFSVSKIWLRGKKDRPNAVAAEPSRRAFSFRFPGNQNAMASDESKAKNDGCRSSRRTISEIDSCRWENGGSEVSCDLESQRYNSLDIQERAPSFARRTLLWLMGRQNKVVNSTFPSNV